MFKPNYLLTQHISGHQYKVYFEDGLYFALENNIIPGWFIDKLHTCSKFQTFYQ